MREEGLEVQVDQIGNVFGLWRGLRECDHCELLMGSHIDTVTNAGTYDGAYGVIAALECVAALRAAGVHPRRTIGVVAFTNEEGVRFAPDMMGSAVHAGALSLEEALASRDASGCTVASALARIGYRGETKIGSVRTSAFLELHIEQGPVLNAAGAGIGVVSGIQGIAWYEVELRGEANHAGTTPMSNRRDALVAAAELVLAVRQLTVGAAAISAATVGSLIVGPGEVNVVPGVVRMSLDLREPRPERFGTIAARVDAAIAAVVRATGVEVTARRTVHLPPIRFDESLTTQVESAAAALGCSTMRLVSGAGHDAGLMAKIVPTAMIFVPSADGLSHCPGEYTPAEQLVDGANVLLRVVWQRIRDG